MLEIISKLVYIINNLVNFFETSDLVSVAKTWTSVKYYFTDCLAVLMGILELVW